MVGRPSRFTPTMTDSPSTDSGNAAPSGNRSIISLLAVAVFAVVALLVIFNVGGGDSDSSADGLNQFQFTTPDGETTTFAAYEGSPLVVNYFAAWCGPCRAELPEFETVSQDVAADGVVFLGISRDNDTSAWQSLIDDTGVTFDTMFEGADAGSFEYLDARGMPTTVFIRADGTVAEVFSGLLPEQTLRDKIDEFLMES